MSLEKNKDTLKDALEQMKSYAPSDQLWGAIEAGLNTPVSTNEEVLHEAIGQLPEHSPPASVWNDLRKSLDTEKGAKRVQMHQRRRWLSIAAAAAVLVLSVFWMFGEAPPKISKQYAQETMKNFQLNIDWNADEESFERLQDQLASLDDPQLNNLKLELQELSSARSDVEEMLKSYGQDPQLVNQLGDIERERSDIYRQIIELI